MDLLLLLGKTRFLMVCEVKTRVMNICLFSRLDDASEPGRVRCVLVIVQYVAKLHKEKLIKVVQALEAARSLAPLGKKQYNMRLETRWPKGWMKHHDSR